MIVQTLFWKSYTNTMVRSPGTANPPSMPSGPWHENREQRIEYVDSNPKLKGSKSNLKYDQYKIATTVGQARDQGASTKDLQFDHKKGYLKLLSTEDDAQENELDSGVAEEESRNEEMPDDDHDAGSDESFPGEPGSQADSKYIWMYMWKWHINKARRAQKMFRREHVRRLLVERQLRLTRIHLSICKGYVRWGRDPLRMMLARSQPRVFLMGWLFG